MNKPPLPDKETLSNEIHAAPDCHFKDGKLTEETAADVRAVVMGVLTKYEIPPNLVLAEWYKDWMNERGPLQ